MANFCPACGTALTPTSRFCPNCGAPVPQSEPEDGAPQTPPTVYETPQEAPRQADYVMPEEVTQPRDYVMPEEVTWEKAEPASALVFEMPAEIPQEEMEQASRVDEIPQEEPRLLDYDMYRETPQAEVPQAPIAYETPQEVPQQPVYEMPQKATQQIAQAVAPGAESGGVTAWTGAGEMACDALKTQALGAVSGVIPGPLKLIAAEVKKLISAVSSAIREPKKLIPVFILAGLWLILDILQALGVKAGPVRVLSFLTFASGGMTGGLSGLIGGVVGKGIFAGALLTVVGSLTRKGGAKLPLGQMVKGAVRVSLDTLGPYLTGVGAALALYMVISGGAVRASFMGGIAAAFLAARSVVQSGFVYRLAASFSAKGKEKAGPGADAFVRGLSVGFAGAALLGLTGIALIPQILGRLLIIAGIVLTVLVKFGVIKPGKGAAK